MVMIGEIRDKETAEIALRAAQTGHLAFSTLHTNDSISSVTRLLDLGAPAYEIPSAVTAVIAQRLIRRLCARHTSAVPSQEYVGSLMSLGVSEPPKVHNSPKGCRDCDFTGYRGRIGVFELLSFTEAIQKAARLENHEDTLRAQARLNGMKPLQEHALNYVLDGLTTIEEVRRVVPLSGLQRAESCRGCSRALAPDFVFCPSCLRRSPR